jgi:hypothetical protein
MRPPGASGAGAGTWRGVQGERVGSQRRSARSRSHGLLLGQTCPPGPHLPRPSPRLARPARAARLYRLPRVDARRYLYVQRRGRHPLDAGQADALGGALGRLLRARRRAREGGGAREPQRAAVSGRRLVPRSAAAAARAEPTQARSRSPGPFPSPFPRPPPPRAGRAP